MKKSLLLLLLVASTGIVRAYDFKVDSIYYYIKNRNAKTVGVIWERNLSNSNYSGLTNAVIPDSVTYQDTTYRVISIDLQAFACCSSLKSISISNSVIYIGAETFMNCSGLTSVTLGNGVTSIDYSAFSGCSSLSSITIPNSVTHIEGAIFPSCSSLTSMTVEAGNSVYDSRDNCNAIIETATNTLIAGCQNTTIPNSVTSIGNDAFISCSSLSSITIPNSVTSISAFAFTGCSGLTSVTIPNGVTNIGNSAFSNCSGLTSITCEAVTPPTLSTNVFQSVNTSIPLYVPASSISLYRTANQWKNFTNIQAIIPSGPFQVDSIYYQLISYQTKAIEVTCELYNNQSNYSGLTHVDIPDSVAYKGTTYNITGIGDSAFYYSRSLTSIAIPNSVTSIGQGAFSSCRSLTMVTIPNSVTSIGSNAFEKCSSLTSITIGNSVMDIGNNAFTRCSSLASITSLAITPPNLGSQTFDGVPDSIIVYVPRESFPLYQMTKGWNNFNIVAIPCDTTYESSMTYNLCGANSFMWNDKVYTENGIYVDTLQSDEGCDSIVILELNLLPTYLYSDTMTIYDGTMYHWRGRDLVEAGTYYDSLQSVSGCDSVYMLTLSIGKCVIEIDTTILVCYDELPYEHKGVQYWDRDSTFTDTIFTRDACDTIFITHFIRTIKCSEYHYYGKYCVNDYPILWNDTIKTSGIYRHQEWTSYGLDSVYRIMVDVYPTYEDSIPETVYICQGDTFVWYYSDYTQSGQYSFTLLSQEGCDSVVKLDLIVGQVYHFTDTISLCDAESYHWRGLNLTMSGIYYDSLISSAGCDSIYQLNLTFNQSYYIKEYASTCQGTAYMWHGRRYSVSGIYYDSLQTLGGCDSICTLILTIDSITTMQEEKMTVCAKELPVIWRGHSLTAAGIYYDTIRNISGCDSIYYSLNLIVNHEATTTKSSVICDGETIIWHGRMLTKQGLYYDTLQTIKGCDSICILNLTVNPTYYIEEIVSIREDKLPYQWQGGSLTKGGNYVVEYESVHGCDSIITLRLMVTELPIYTVNVVADHGHVNGTGTYPEGTQITLTAVPDEGFEFQMWSDGLTTNPKNFTVMQDTTFRAHFFMPEVEQEVVVDSIETNSVTITWDTIPGATLYELRIYKNGQLVVTYQIDADNNIIDELFNGPDRIIARKDSTGGSSETLQVEVSGLESGQDYTYTLDALDDDRSYVGAQSGSFTTEEEPINRLDTPCDNRCTAPRKVLRDGHIYIEMPDGTWYTPIGQKVERTTTKNENNQ